MSKELLLSSFLEGKPYHQLSEYIKGKTSCFAENLVGSSLSFVLFAAKFRLEALRRWLFVEPKRFSLQGFDLAPDAQS